MKIRLWWKHKQKHEKFSNESLAKEAEILQTKTNEFEELSAIGKYVSKCLSEEQLISDETQEEGADEESNEYIKAFEAKINKLMEEFENEGPMHFD